MLSRLAWRTFSAVAGMSLFVTSCGPAGVESAYCAHADDVYDAAGIEVERATNELFHASVVRDRTPALLAPVGGGQPQRNPEHVEAAEEVADLEQEIRAHLERFTAIVEQRPDCFTFGERADARRLRSSLDTAA